MSRSSIESAVVELIDYPKPWAFFWAAMALSLGYMAFALIRKWVGWSHGIKEPSPGSGSFRRPAYIWIAEVFLQRQLFMLSFFRWFVHILIFYGFIGLLLLPVIASLIKAAGYLVISSSYPRFYLHPAGYILIKIWGDSFGLLLLLGLVIACIRRFVQRPAQQVNSQTDVMLLVFLLAATISGFALEGLRLALVPGEVARYSFIGRLFTPPGTYSIKQLQPWLTACWSLHISVITAFFFYLPHSKLMHSILAPVVIAMNAAGEHEREDIYWPEISKHRAGKSPPG